MFIKNIRKSLRQFFQMCRLLKEKCYYQYKFNTLNLNIPTEETIRDFFSNNLKKNKGSLLILSIYHSYNWESVNLGPALSQFGEVIHIDWKDKTITGGISYGDPRWFDIFNSNLFAFIVESLNGQRPDVIFTYLSHDQIDLTTLTTLRKLRAPIVNLSLNDKEHFIGTFSNGRYGGMRDICNGFDLCWTSTDDSLIKYCVEGAKPLYLPEGANPIIHKPYEEEKFIYDIGFVGQCYGNRPVVIERLRQVGFQIVAFGPGWPSGQLTHEAMIRTWSRCRINLGFAGVADFKNTFCLKGRDFELPMSGGLYLTEHNEEIGNFYKIGVEILTYQDFDDLVEKIRWILAHPQEAATIREQGRLRALRDHTWEIRFQKVFEILGVLR